MYQWILPTLVQRIAYRSAPSCYLLSQCCYLVNWDPWLHMSVNLESKHNSLQRNTLKWHRRVYHKTISVNISIFRLPHINYHLHNQCGKFRNVLKVFISILFSSPRVLICCKEDDFIKTRTKQYDWRIADDTCQIFIGTYCAYKTRTET